VLGVTALESFGLEVDPVRGTLKEAELLMLTFQLESPFPSTNEIECTIKTQHQLRSGE
jgi:hypothetical protein